MIVDMNKNLSFQSSSQTMISSLKLMFNVGTKTFYLLQCPNIIGSISTHQCHPTNYFESSQDKFFLFRSNSCKDLKAHRVIKIYILISLYCAPNLTFGLDM